MAERAVAEPAFVGKLVEALGRELPGAQVQPEHVRGERYRFVVFWPAFDRMGHPERQKMVWDVASKVVAPSDLWNVGMILTIGEQDLPEQEDQS